MAQISILKLSEVIDENRIDSEYFRKDFLKIISKIEKKENRYLGDLCLIKSGRTPKYFEDGEIRVIRSGDLNRNLFIDKEELLKTKGDKLFFVNNNDILISSIGRGSIGKINIYDDKEKLATVSEVNVLRSPKINPHYLFTFLRTKFGQYQINREITGATGQQHLLKSNVKKILTPIPSNSFQNKIQEMVLQAKKDYKESKKLYQNAEDFLLKEVGLKDYKPRFQLTFTSNYSNILNAERIDSDYFQPKYDKIVEKINNYSGSSDYLKNIINIKDKNFKPKKGESYRYIELSSIGQNGWIRDFTFDKGENLPTRARRLVNEGDVVISSIKGSLSSSALITKEFEKSICSNGFYVINSKQINPETLLVLFKSWFIQDLLKKGCSGTILTAISKSEFQKLRIPIIKEATQQKISELIEESFRLRDNSRNLLQKAIKEVEDYVESK